MNVRFLVLAAGLVAGCEEPPVESTCPPDYRAVQLSSELAPYDDFSAAKLDATHWERLERVGEIEGDALHLEARHTYGLPLTEGGSMVSAPGSHTHLQATVTLLDHSQTGGQTRAVAGFLYQPPEDRVGNSKKHRTVARVQLMDNGSGLFPAAVVLTCLDDTCSDRQTATFVSETGDAWPSSIAEDTPYTVSVRYDDGADTFALSLGGSTRTYDVSGLTHFDPADLLWTMLAAQARQMTNPGDEGSIAATFDDVVVDDVAWDDFDGETRLDPAKWTELEFSREVVSGELSIRHALADASPFESGRGVRFLDPDGDDAISASAVVDVLEGDVSRARARIGGMFFNDGSAGDGQGGRNGDVFAELGLYGTTARYFVFRCASADCETREVLSSDADSGEPGRFTVGDVALGEWHDLFVQFDGEVFAFQLDDDPIVVFDPSTEGATPTADATDPFRLVGSRCVVGTGEHCYQEARFDDVSVGASLSLCE